MRIKGKDRIRTYIYDVKESYVIILEPQRKGLDYYLLTAYYINEESEKQNIKKKSKRKLGEVH
jgi:transcription initiation factor IIE alpha subunit